MDVAVVTVGDVLLVGETENTNASWLGRRLAERGATVRRMLVVPDEQDVIANSVARYADAFDAVVVTGGLGPTHDDVTLDGVAHAFDLEMVEHEDAVIWFDEHVEYSRQDLVSGTMKLPDGASMIPNDEGVAPGAIVENVYVLPGVPDEMRAMYERIQEDFQGEQITTEIVHSEGPESALIDVLNEANEHFDVRVGSYPNDGVRLKIAATDPDEVERAAEWLRDRV
ncbi:competence/damage-inducible protein A [Halanaeroarchaeum sulfurireducens]|uniref:Competence-damage protein CinA-like n=1 Tax=Halanaeroarchaeum sulfurireducens TaxID=1604004 RepID=A0A0N7FTN5_9EURY|nr:molybdopterin-binding protein [Halanaeroarchaeum sulfurireducens]ALG82055.1 competence-damage protein CinA-like [Halanaeroarchaeum sulfurireducens]